MIRTVYLIFLLIALHSLQGQSLNLFEKEIYSLIRNNQRDQSLLNDQLFACLKLDPSTIPLLLRLYDSKGIINGLDSHNDLRLRLKNRLLSSANSKNQLFLSYLKEINEDLYDGYLKYELIEIFENELINLPQYEELFNNNSLKKYSLNNNQRDIVSLGKDSEASLSVYSHDESYGEMLDSLLVSQANSFKRQIRLKNELTIHQKDSVINAALNFAYIFQNAYLDEYQKIPYTLLEFLIEIISPQEPEFSLFYHNVHNNRFALGYYLVNIEEQFPDIIQIKNPELDFKGAVSFNAEYKLGVSYKISLIPDNFYFSYINIYAGLYKLRYSQTPGTIVNDHIIIDLDTYSADGYFKYSNFKLNNKYGFDLGLSLPVLRVFDSFYLEAGYSYSHFDLSGTFDSRFVGRYDVWDSGNYEFFNSEIVSFQKHVSKHEFNLRVNFVIIDRINAQILTQNAESIQIGFLVLTNL
jgi:hypothetical protein